MVKVNNGSAEDTKAPFTVKVNNGLVEDTKAFPLVKVNNGLAEDTKAPGVKAGKHSSLSVRNSRTLMDQITSAGQLMYAAERIPQALRLVSGC